MSDQDLVRCDLVEVREGRYCFTGAIHECGRYEQSQLVTAQEYLSDLAMELALGAKGPACLPTKLAHEVFARVVSEILRRIESGTGPQKAVGQAFQEFRRLLQKERVGPQDEKKVVGLIGELLTLIELLELDRKSIHGWHGPDSDRHDFRAGSVTIEVKTSQGADGNKVHINGIQQLVCADAGTLLLRHVRIEPDPDGDLALPALAQAASTMVEDADLLDDKLENLGYTEDDKESWQEKRYRLIDSTAYHVRDGFPRLTPAQLNVDWPLVGVSAVSYELDLASASNYKLTDDEWRSETEEFCECL